MFEKKLVRKERFNSVVLISFSFLVCLLMVGFVSAVADVAYIYKNSKVVDENILDVFDSMGLSVDEIDETELSGVDFSAYKFLFVGDERFRNEYNIPVGEYPSIVSNYYFGLEWGLTDFDGISKLASNSPLNVKIDDDVVQVYTQARFNSGSISIPYYYLDDENKVSSMQKVAGTHIGGDYDFGDVISYAGAGTDLINGHTSEEKICFFGIIESDYWTTDARELFEDCVGYVGMSCSEDSECGEDDYFGDEFCKNGDVYQEYKEYDCNNPGTVDSECDESVEDRLIQVCDYGCANGDCLLECYEDSDCASSEICVDNSCVDIVCKVDADCDDINAYTEDSCVNPGTVDSFCSYEPIECLQDLDCDDSSVNTQDSCINPGSVDSYCTNEGIICFDDIDCDDSDDYTLDNCENSGTIDSYCTNDPVNCIADSDCGEGSFIGDLFCTGDDVFQEYKDWECKNPGTLLSACINVYEDRQVEQCVDTCIDGSCEDIECERDSDCDDSDVYTIDSCVNPGTAESYCVNEDVVCVEDSDCGTDGFFDGLFCNGVGNKNVWQNYKEWTCENPGTISSSCSQTIEQREVSVCDDFCIDGQCLDIVCEIDADCDDSNSETTDYCNNPGTIDSFCSHEDILCVNDGECGTERFVGDLYCLSDEVYRNLMSFTCNNPGFETSFCSNDFSDEKLFDCQYGCANGICVRCNDNIDCDDSDSSTEDICWFSGTVDSYCTQEHIECTENIECGSDSYVGVPYCSGDNLYQNYRTFGCENSGTPGSYCNAHVSPDLIQTCEYGCSDGGCLEGVHDVGFVDFTGSVNGILLEYADGTDITEEVPVLSCGDVIKAKVKVENKGNFEEDVILANNGLSFLINNIDDLGVGSSSYRSSLSPYIILDTEGIFEINLDADIFGDINLMDNNVVRTIEVVCPECVKDTDCDDDYNSDNYCKGDNVYTEVHDFSCELGECSEDVFEELVVQCDDTCVDGECVEIICYNNANCDDSDAYTKDSCINPGEVESYCTNEPIECLDDLDCGVDGFIGDLFCSGNDVFKNFKEYDCINQGSIDSYCSDDVEERLITNCAFGCLDGSCFGECLIDSECGVDYYSDNYCVGDDVYKDLHDFVCENFGCSEDIIDELVEQCADACVDGECAEITCTQDSDCDDSDAYTEDTCNNPGTVDSYCTNEEIVCLSNSDCGVDGLLDNEYCNSGDVFDMFVSYNCLNAGTIESSCSYVLGPELIEDCGENNCGDYSANYCKDDDAYRSRMCGVNGCLNGACVSSVYLDEDLVQECDYGCAEGICIGECLINEDCDEDYYSDNYCGGDDLYRDFHDFSCEDLGCLEEISEDLVELCADTCVDGECVEITCYNDAECDDSDAYTEDTCNNPGTVDSYCGYEDIVCLNNLDCGTNGFIGDLFCSGNDVFKNFKEFDCINQGSIDSYCIDSTEGIFVTNCEHGCVDGSCIDIECYNDADCDDSEAYTEDTCMNPGTQESSCTYEPIACLGSSDCGTNGLLDDLFCGLGSVFDNFVTYNCLNAGTAESSCTYLLAPQLVEYCGEDSCGDYGEDYCKDDDAYHSRICSVNGCEQGACVSSVYLDESLVEECAYDCVDGDCVGECSEDSDCGDDYYGDNFCKGDDVYHEFHEFECETFECSEYINDELVEECVYGCANDECIEFPECNDGIDNSDQDGEIDALVEDFSTVSGSRSWYKDPMGIRDFINDLDTGLSNIPSSYDGAGAMNYDLVTAQRICELAGYSTAESYDCVSNYNGRCGWHSCNDNVLAKWNTGAEIFDIQNACDLGNRWIASLTCVDKYVTTECNDGIDNDNDGDIDYPEDDGCNSVYDISETLHDSDCVDLEDDSESF